MTVFRRGLILNLHELAGCPIQAFFWLEWGVS